MSGGILEAALSYTAHGISVLPMQDKFPHQELLPRGSNNKIAWSPYQLAIAPTATLYEWFGPAHGIAAICGEVSGNLAALDFDIREGYEKTFDEYLHLLALLDPDLANLPRERSPSGGIHVFFRTQLELSSTLLAKDPKNQTLIELKGKGECLNCAPTPGYTSSISSLEDVPTISDQQLSNLLRICRSLTKILPPQRSDQVNAKDGPAARFDASHTTEDMLEWLLKAGWKKLSTSNGVTYLTRPGKERGISATLGWNGLPILRNFSANSGLEVQAYGAFGLYSALKHEGNHSATAKEVLRSEPPQRPQFLRDLSEPILRWDDVPTTNGAHHTANGTDATLATPSERRGFSVLRGAQLRNMPAPKELIADWILRAPTFMLYARAGVGKTFLAVDMAMCIASGKPWHGHAVMQGPVLYIAAEGAYGIGKRADAWLKQYNNDEDIEDFVLVSHPVFPTWGDTLSLIKYTIEENNLVGLQAIFIDTLAQCFGEGDESDNHDSQMFLSAVAAIAQETGATVGLVHHSGWDESRLRGASNFRNSVDTVIQLVAGDDLTHFTIRHDKIKDLEQAEPMRMERLKIGPNKEDSCYIRPVGAAQAATAYLTTNQVAILAVLDTSSFEGCRATALIAACGLPRSTFYRTLFELVKGNLIFSTGEERAATRTHRITEGGKKALELRVGLGQ